MAVGSRLYTTLFTDSLGMTFSRNIFNGCHHLFAIPFVSGYQWITNGFQIASHFLQFGLSTKIDKN